MSILWLAWLACGGVAVDTEVGTDTQPIIDEVIWSGACAWPTSLDASRLVYADVGTIGAAWEPNGRTVLAVETDWAAFIAGWQAPVDVSGVDFASEDLVAVWMLDGGCSTDLEASGIGADGSLYLGYADPNGGCGYDCDWERWFLVVYAVDEGVAPTVCSRIVRDCG